MHMPAVTIQPRPPTAAATALLEQSQLPASDLTDAHMEHFFYAGPREQPVGLVGLELFGPCALLRSLVVAGESRSAGLGSALIERAEAHARERGAHSVYLLTTTAEAFFSRRGYRAAARETAPAAIRNCREFADLCPSSSAFLVKSL
jgi:amino-acid N-acetyltransferase